MSVAVSPASRFAYIEVVSPTWPSLFPYTVRVDSPTFKVVLPTLTNWNNYFVKIDEYHCLQSAEESYFTVFPVKFRDITAFDWGGDRLWFELSGGSRNGDSTVLSPLFALSDFFGGREVERKITQQQLCVNKQSCKVEQGLLSPGQTAHDSRW